MRASNDRYDDEPCVRLRAVVAFLLVLAACGAPGATNTYIGGEGRDTRERLRNRELGRNLELRNVRLQRNGENRLHVQFELHNKKATRVAFEWSVVWFDPDGFAINSPSHYNPAILQGREYESITLTAPTLDASQFKLSTRYPDPVR